MLVVLGGDGTFLRAAMAVSEVDVPLIGINLGKVGFLSKAEAGDMETVLAAIAGGDYTLEERMAIEGRVMRGGAATGQRLVALNDIVVARGSLARRLPSRRRDRRVPPGHLHRGRPRRRQPDRVDRLLLLGRRSDPRPGQPQSHRDADRRLPVGPPLGRGRADQVVRCTVVDAFEALVSIDGREDLQLAVGDVVEVRALERPIRLVVPRGSQPFWDLLRHKVALLPS